MKQKENFSRLPVIFAAALFLLFVFPCLVREFWFDEALTLMNFAWLADPVKIYSSYVIPNNQIFFTICLHYWSLLPRLGLREDFFLRLLPLGFAGGTLWVLYQNFRSYLGRNTLLISLTALALSSPFLIYATALRGYMASAFFVSCTLVWARAWIKNPSWRTGIKYFIGCLLAVGTIPSNLLALGGVVLFLLPQTGKEFWRLKRFWFLGAIPFIALVVFYFPILSSFLCVCRLGEGWQSRIGVTGAYFTAVAAVFGILWIPCLLWSLRRKKNLYIIGIMLLPLIAAFVLPTAPFPRVFFPLFPVLVLGIARGLHGFKAMGRKKYGRKVLPWWETAAAIAVLVCAWTLKQEKALNILSDLCGGPGGDDFFYGYYMRKDHVPQQTALQLQKIYGENPLPAVYISFAADPWPVMYYMLSNNLQSKFLFDGPRGRVEALPVGSLVIISQQEKPQSITERFQCSLKLLCQNPKHQIFLVE